MSEFFHMLKDPKISEMKAKIMMKFNFAKKEQKKHKEKIGRMLQKTNGLSQNNK